MQLFVNTPTGTTKLVTLDPLMTVAVLKQLIIANIPSELLSLSNYKGDMEDSRILMSYPIQNFQTLSLSYKCVGGVMTETEKLIMRNNLKKTVCRVCYATNAVRASNCRKKKKCGRSTKLRPKKTEVKEKEK